MSDTLASELSSLQADVSSLTDAVQRNTTLVQGLNAQLQAAIEAAANAGATPQQLEQLHALSRQIEQDTADLASAAAGSQQSSGTQTPTQPPGGAPGQPPADQPANADAGNTTTGTP